MGPGAAEFMSLTTNLANVGPNEVSLARKPGFSWQWPKDLTVEDNKRAAKGKVDNQLKDEKEAKKALIEYYKKGTAPLLGLVQYGVQTAFGAAYQLDGDSSTLAASQQIIGGSIDRALRDYLAPYASISGIDIEIDENFRQLEENLWNNPNIAALSQRSFNWNPSDANVASFQTHVFGTSKFKRVPNAPSVSGFMVPVQSTSIVSAQPAAPAIIKPAADFAWGTTIPALVSPQPAAPAPRSDSAAIAGIVQSNLFSQHGRFDTTLRHPASAELQQGADELTHAIRKWTDSELSAHDLDDVITRITNAVSRFSSEETHPAATEARNALINRLRNVRTLLDSVLLIDDLLRLQNDTDVEEADAFDFLVRLRSFGTLAEVDDPQRHSFVFGDLVKQETLDGLLRRLRRNPHQVVSALISVIVDPESAIGVRMIDDRGQLATLDAERKRLVQMEIDGQSKTTDFYWLLWTIALESLRDMLTLADASTLGIGISTERFSLLWKSVQQLQDVRADLERMPLRSVDRLHSQMPPGDKRSRQDYCTKVESGLMKQLQAVFEMIESSTGDSSLHPRVVAYVTEQTNDWWTPELQRTALKIRDTYHWLDALLS